MPSSLFPHAAHAQPSRGIVRAKYCGNFWSVATAIAASARVWIRQVMHHGSPVQGKGETKGVGKLLGQSQRRLDTGHSLIGVPEEPEGWCRGRAATHPGVVSAVECRMSAVPLRIIELHPLFQVGPGGDQLAAKEHVCPWDVVGLQPEVRVSQALGQAKELLP